MDAEIRDNPGERRFEMSVGNGETAAVYYRFDDGKMALIHTEVPFRYAGSGVGTALAKQVFEKLRREHRTTAVRCEFLNRYVASHPEVSELVTG